MDKRKTVPGWLRFAGLCVLISLLIGPVSVPGAVPEGKRVFVCGHSFHWYLNEMLAEAAMAAGIKDHQSAGVQKLGGSKVIQHWELPDEKNIAKKVLREGNVDVLTLSPHFVVPDPGIDNFVDLAVKHNPDIQVFIQISWPARDGSIAPGSFKKEDYDLMANEGFQQMRVAMDSLYIWGLARQAKDLNKRYGREVVQLVPVCHAVIKLRKKIIAGEVPGIKKQSDLFSDALGHPQEPLKWLNTYCFFAAIYDRSPVGLKTFEQNGDEASQKLNRLLQEIAWDTVKNTKFNGADPISYYEKKECHGFTLLVNKEVFQHQSEFVKAKDEMDRQLGKIAETLPAAALEQMRKVRIWVEYKAKENGAAEFHPSEGWLRDNGYNVEKADCVEINNIANFVKWSQVTQPCMVLHEMSHALHHIVLGDGYKVIKDAYKNACEQKIYESVEFVTGGKKRAYGLNNEKEYFAELTEAYFGKNDFYPFTRGDLEKYDPAGFKMVQDAWGVER